MESAYRALYALAQRLAAVGSRQPRFSILEPAAAAHPPSSGAGGSGAGSGTAAAAALLRQATSAAIAAALAVGVGGTVAQCEASTDPDSSGRVHAAVGQLWLTLVEQAHRIEASLAHQLPEIPPPDVHVVPGAEVEVTWRLPQELDVPGALQELRRHLRSPAFTSREEGSWGSTVSESVSSGAEGRATHLVRRSRGLGALSVLVMQPHDQQLPARLCFRGSASERDLALMSAALQAAMAPRRRRGALEEFQELGRLFDGGAGGGSGPFGRALEGAVDPFFEHLREFMEGFQRMAEGEGWQAEIEEGGGERDTEPTPLRGPKRFDDWRSQQQPPRRLDDGRRGGAGGGSAGAYAGSEPATPEQLEQQRKQRQLDAAVKKLEKAGAQVFVHDARDTIDWGILAGCDEQKRQIEDTVLLALMHGDVYADIARGTRKQFASNRPRAVLFEGPPGTGKTTSARVIASQAAVPLVYIPLEAVVSKWYGESEKQLADMLKACESFPEGCIIFLDELDALATSRSSEMHEATRRVLGVLLRHLDGFDAESKRTIVIGATNRKQDLDPALISRFGLSVGFELPSEACRADILRQYARHLQGAEVLAVTHATPGLAGRDLKSICEQAERRWASKIIRGQAAKGQLPPLAEYLDAARQRLREMAGLPPAA